MKYKYLIIVSLLLTILIIGAVSASEDVSGDNLTAETTEMSISDENDISSVGKNGNFMLASENEDVLNGDMIDDGEFRVEVQNYTPPGEFEENYITKVINLGEKKGKY